MTSGERWYKLADSSFDADFEWTSENRQHRCVLVKKCGDNFLMIDDTDNL